MKKFIIIVLAMCGVNLLDVSDAMAEESSLSAGVSQSDHRESIDQIPFVHRPFTLRRNNVGVNVGYSDTFRDVDLGTLQLGQRFSVVTAKALYGITNDVEVGFEFVPYIRQAAKASGTLWGIKLNEKASEDETFELPTFHVAYQFLDRESKGVAKLSHTIVNDGQNVTVAGLSGKYSAGLLSGVMSTDFLFSDKKYDHARLTPEVQVQLLPKLMGALALTRTYFNADNRDDTDVLSPSILYQLSDGFDFKLSAGFALGEEEEIDTRSGALSLSMRL